MASSTASKPEWAVPLTVAGTMLSACASGVMASFSFVPIPVIVANASTLGGPNVLRLWRGIYDYGIRSAPPLAVAAAVVHATNAYLHYSSSATEPSSLARRKAFVSLAGAAAISAAIVPFTMIAMLPTNKELMARESGAVADAVRGGGGAAGTSTKDLVKWWGTLNLVRAVLPAVGALLGFRALVAE